MVTRNIRKQGEESKLNLKHAETKNYMSPKTSLNMEIRGNKKQLKHVETREKNFDYKKEYMEDRKQIDKTMGRKSDLHEELLKKTREWI